MTARRPASRACWNMPPTCSTRPPCERSPRASSGCSTAAVAEPDRAIGSLDILSADERHTILTAWNDTARTIPHTTIPELFAQQAARTPDAVALVFDDATLSYRELDTRANQLAHHLRTLGAGPETIVGLCVERSFDMVIALIGILKAGAAYLPLDPDYPQQRLRFMLDDAAAPILITHGALRSTPAPSITPASLISTPTAPSSRRNPPRRRPAASTPAPPPTSSTPQAQQDNQKPSPSRMVASPITCSGWRATIRHGPDDTRPQPHRHQLRRRGLGNLAAARHRRGAAALRRPRRHAIPASSLR